jgi:hypothetical protein
MEVFVSLRRVDIWITLFVLTISDRIATAPTLPFLIRQAVACFFLVGRRLLATRGNKPGVDRELGLDLLGLGQARAQTPNPLWCPCHPEARARPSV